MEDCRIALVSMASAVGEIEQNLYTILDMTKQAADGGAQFVVFPELALTGYSHPNVDSIALRVDDSSIRQLSETAINSKITLLVGFAERSDDAQRPYISQLIVLPDGKIEVYHKVHLGRFEKDIFTAGKHFPVYHSQGVNFAVGICWDWHFPEVAAIYSLKGAEILFAPHASLRISGDRHEIWQQYMGTRAYDNSVYLAACNTSGMDSQGREFSGGAMVWGPKGEIVAQSPDPAEHILFADLSAQRLNHIRNQASSSMKDSFFLAARRKELYQELLQLEID